MLIRDLQKEGIDAESSSSQKSWINANKFLIINVSKNMNELENRMPCFQSLAIYATLENEIDEDKHTPEQISHIKFENQQEEEIDDEDSLLDMSEQLLNKAKSHGKMNFTM